MNARTRRLLSLAAVAALFAMGARSEAGGPLFVVDGKPVLWADHNVSGGPLGTQTVSVDAKGHRTVYYRVDEGTLGPLSHAQAQHFVERIFGEYTDIPTADISFANAGPILDPDTGLPVDVDATNFGKFENGTFQNPIIFDSDGAITGGGGVLGFFEFIQTDANQLTESLVVLNGAAIGGPFGLTRTSFLGVFTHEFGHFAGPLDHEQINGNIGFQGELDEFGIDGGAKVPAGFSGPAAYDLFAPFTETLFPFLYSAPTGATLGFEDSGYFIASFDIDTVNTLSNLYPTKTYQKTRTGIDGKVVIRSGSERVEVPGMNVVARRIDRRVYPPSPTAVAFPTPPTLDADGVPSVPPARAATDSLATASSAVTGLDFGLGGYRIQGLPLGLYQVQLQQIGPFFTGGSGIGPLGEQLTLPVREEYFDLGHTSNDVKHFFPVPAVPGFVTPHVDLEINGLDNRPPKRVAEHKPNFHVATAQVLDRLPARVTGRASAGEPSELTVDFGGGFTESFQSLYRITVPDTRFLYIVLEPTGGSGDIDLFLFLPTVGPMSVDFADVVDLSAGPTANEVIGQVFPAGEYIIGVGAFDGDVRYTLHVIPGDGAFTP